MQIQRKHTKNKLDTLFIQNPGLQSGSIQIWFRTGSALEEKSNQGIAHFLEHMFFKGTKKRPNGIIAEEVESFGGELNAFTSFDYTCYYINAPKQKINQSVDILLDMVSNPQFKHDELVPERQVVFEEYRRSQDSPNQFNFQQIQKSCFRKAYAHPILGNTKTINSFSIKQLKDFRSKFYSLSNALLVVSGDYDQAKIEKTINSYKMPKGISTDFPKFELKNKSQINIHEKDVEHATLTFCWQAPKYEEKSAAQEDIALGVLAHGETSRLYKKLITETTLVNGVGASSMFFAKGGIHFLRFNFPLKNMNKVKKEFLKILKESLNTPIKDQEVNKIKQQYLASKIYEKETIESYAFSLGHGFAQNGDIHSEEKFIENIKRQTSSSVSDGLVNILSRPVHLTLQTPNGTKSDKIKSTLQSWIDDISKVKKKSNQKKMNIKKSKFDSAAQFEEIIPGVTLFYRKHDLSPTFSLQTFIKGGLSEENKSNNGIHSLISKLLPYGPKSQDYMSFKLSLETKSAYLNGVAGKNAYGLTIHGQSQHWTDLSANFFETWLNPGFEEQFTELEKTMVYRTLEAHQKDPTKQLFRTFNNTLFNKHPYAQNILGTKQSIESIDSNKLSKFHSNNLKKKEMVISYVGDLEYSQIRENILEKIKSIKPRKASPLKLKNWDPIKKFNHHIDFDREQTQIFIGFPAFTVSDKQDLYLKILTSHLSGQSSELFVDVRDKKGLCYAVQPIHFTALEAGFWGIYIGAGNDKKTQAIDAILEILNKIKDKGFTQKQLNQVKTMLLGRQQMSLQSGSDYANFYTIPILQNLGMDHAHKNREALQKIKKDDLNKFLKKYLEQKHYLLTAGTSN